jgi:DNA-binding CsgD family transcriptional regulator
MNDQSRQNQTEIPAPAKEAPAPAGVREAERLAAKARRRRCLARRQACFEALSAGYSHEEIARRLKISVATVRRDVERGIDERRLDAPERYVHLQVDRLTRALRSMDDLVERGDVRAVKPLVSLVGALDRYHGLDASWRRDPSFLAAPAPAPAAPLALSAPFENFAKVAEIDTQVIEKTCS